MSAILLPEVTIQRTLKEMVEYIRKEISLSTNPKNTLLYSLLGKDENGNEFTSGKYNFFNNAKAIFEQPKNLSINFGYNSEVARNNSFHILLPSETATDAAIGTGQGYMTSTSSDDEGSERENFTQMFNSTYQILISGDNNQEVLLIYNIFKALFVVFTPYMEILGLRNMKVSGNDIIMRDEFTQAQLFQKVLNLSFMYELIVETPIVLELIKNIFYKIQAVASIEE